MRRRGEKQKTNLEVIKECLATEGTRCNLSTGRRFLNRFYAPDKCFRLKTEKDSRYFRLAEYLKKEKRSIVFHPFILFNHEVYKMIVIDIDDINYREFFRYDLPGAYISEGLPVPNVIVTTTRGLQLFFFIDGYIATKNKKAYKYFQNIQRKLIQLFKSDPNMNHRGTCRNPFFNHRRRKRHIHTEQEGYILRKEYYKLDELSAIIESHFFEETQELAKNPPLAKLANGYVDFKVEEWYEGNRNNYMFKHLCAYRTLNNINDEYTLLEYAKMVNYAHSDITPPLPEKELESIVKSIIRHDRKAHIIPNYKPTLAGITGLYALYDGHFFIWTKRRQLGAHIASQIKRLETLKQIVNVLEEKGLKFFKDLNKTKLAEYIGKTRQTIYNYKELINYYVHLRKRKHLSKEDALLLTTDKIIARLKTRIKRIFMYGKRKSGLKKIVDNKRVTSIEYAKYNDAVRSLRRRMFLIIEKLFKEVYLKVDTASLRKNLFDRFDEAVEFIRSKSLDIINEIKLMDLSFINPFAKYKVQPNKVAT
ncbi:primase alpha helix C-terminal domain-containing protein [Deferribacter thermophilus]|uniref:primase alpha helix C-terminal domain-containing protein n=1 Tax=Deferribacter thermophilus TaxID=53573 RepID=UPI003C1C30CE